MLSSTLYKKQVVKEHQNRMNWI